MRAIRLLPFLLLMLSGAALAADGGSAGKGVAPVPELFVTHERCLACHNGLTAPSGLDISMGNDWRSSIMANSARDPYWQASIRREVLDHPQAKAEIQDECSACHMPMARYQAKAGGTMGRVFDHLAALRRMAAAGQAAPNPMTPADRLASDGVSCSMCHQIEAEGLGTPQSFVAGFSVDEASGLGADRQAFGPFEIDGGRKRVMRSSALLEPNQSKHVQDSALCGSCHTLYTHTRGPGGEVIGRLPEQMPYLEWRHSDYTEERSCQSCHMPALEEPAELTSVLGKERDGFSRHVFRGGNFLMLDILRENAGELGVVAPAADLRVTAERTREHLREKSARVALERTALDGRSLEMDVRVENLAGHKLPTAYPSRRAWLRLRVEDAGGYEVFESGALNPDGSIQGNDNDLDPRKYEPHREVLTEPGQVQIYEAVMADPDGVVTTGLLRAIRYVKDNRVLPRGFAKGTAGEDIAVRGGAVDDGDFTAAGDIVRYRVETSGDNGPYNVLAELWYQPIGFRWAKNLEGRNAPEITRFTGYYRGLAGDSAILLASDRETVR